MRFAIAYLTHYGDEFLCGFETACCGTRIIPYFDRLGSSAIPLSFDHAKLLCGRVQKVCPGLKVHVVPYPVKEVQE